MHNQQIVRQIQKLQSLVKASQEACNDNIEMQSQWAKYICVLSAGLVENALKEIYTEYAYRTVSKPVAKFVSSHISQIRNPKIDKLLDIAGSFKDNWKIDLENFANLNGRADALNSIMNNRHLIAHGQNHNSNLTLVQVKDYLAKTIEVLEFVEQQCRQ